jgi:polysaccharide biosynthesis transport protein
MADAYIAPLNAPDDTNDVQPGLPLRELLVAVRRHWWIVALVTGLILVGGYWHTMRQPRLYSATATVRLQPGQAMLPGVNAMPTRLDYRIDPLLSEQQVIRSQQVAERVVQTLGLNVAVATPAHLERSALFGGTVPRADSDAVGRRFRLSFAPDGVVLESGGQRTNGRYGQELSLAGLKVTVPTRPDPHMKDATLEVISVASAARGVRGIVSTRAVTSTDLIEITATGGDPTTIRDIANAMAHVYQQFSTEGIKQSASQKTKFIEQSLADQERSLRAIQDSLKDFKEAHQTADIRADATALFQTIDGFERQRLQTETDRKTYGALLSKVAVADSMDDELRRLAASGAIENNKAFAAKFDQWQTLLQKKQELLLERSRLPNNADLRQLDKEIANTKADLRASAQIYLEGINDRMQTLGSTIASLRGQSERFPPLEAQQARLTASVETAQKMYLELRSQLQLSRISESADAGTVRIIDEAMTPTYAISPRRQRAFFIYLLIGLLVGIGIAVAVERLDDSVRSPLELSEKYSLPVLGMIPAIRSGELSEAPVSAGVSRIVTHADPRSPVAEAYRSLRTNLAFARTQRGLRAVALTSPGPADGKSTTVANLAITFAQQGQRTLLVDADLRRAVLDKSFGIPRSPGLTEVIIGASGFDQAVHETQVPNLFVMTSGQLPPNPSELLGSPAMREVLATMTSQFDMVLFDSPPLLAVTDAAVLSTMVDGTILIARMGATARKGLWRAVSQLRAVHATLLGSVLNDVTSDVGAYYGGYSYYYYYSSHADGSMNGLPAGILARLKRLTSGVTGAGPKWG